MVPSPQFRSWCFTLNNPTTEESPEIWLLASTVLSVKYACFQLEEGEGGTRHWQGYVIFRGRGVRLSGVRRVHARAHWEPRRGTHDEAVAYCSKSGTRVLGEVTYKYGDPPASGGRGARSDLLSVQRALDAGMGEVELSGNFFGPWCRYGKAFKLYRCLRMAQRTWITFTTCYWGMPGVGKTRRVMSEVNGDSCYWLPRPSGKTVWFDGYDGQEDVVIDEFTHWIKRDLLCRLCDRYPFRVETKGGSVPFLAKRIFITSNLAPFQWYPQVGLGPMTRRLTGAHGLDISMLENGDQLRGTGLVNPVPMPSHVY